VTVRVTTSSPIKRQPAERVSVMRVNAYRTLRGFARRWGARWLREGVGPAHGRRRLSAVSNSQVSWSPRLDWRPRPDTDACNGTAQPMRRPTICAASTPNVQLGDLDDDALEQLVLDAVPDTDIQEVMPLTPGPARWTPQRLREFVSFHNGRRGRSPL
jgi:hypothetical protein